MGACRYRNLYRLQSARRMERAAPLLRQVSSLLPRQPCVGRAALCIGSLPVYHPTSCGVYRELGRASMQLAQVLEQGHLASDVGLCGRGVSDCEPRHHPAYEHDISASPDVDPLRGSRGRSNRDVVRYLLRPTEHSVRRLHGGPVRGGRDQDVRGRREGLFRDRSQATIRVKLNFLRWLCLCIDAAATTASEAIFPGFGFCTGSSSTSASRRPKRTSGSKCRCRRRGWPRRQSASAGSTATASGRFRGLPSSTRRPRTGACAGSSEARFGAWQFFLRNQLREDGFSCSDCTLDRQSERNSAS
mgnify:CR=1 FL=1